MNELTDRLERDLREIAAAAHPSPSAWASIASRLGDDGASELELVLESAPTPARSRRIVWLTAAAATIVVIIGLVAVFATRAGDDVVPATAPDTATSPSNAPTTAVPFPDLTTTFISPRNGFSVRYLDRAEGTITPATQLWGFSEQPDDGFDVVETGLAAVFKGTSMEEWPVARFSDDEIDGWIDEHGSHDELTNRGACGVPRSQQAEVTIDGQSGRISECANRIEATVVADGRLYYFVLLHDRSDARAVFDAFAATIDLTPATAVDIPPLTSTFASPTNGFSFGYLDRGEGTLEPATRLWDPVTQPIEDENGAPNDAAFDLLETGMAAFFKGASTTIPDGVPIDQWVDEYVSPSGCGMPRSQQEEISIDGYPARMTTCLNGFQATVVAGGRLYYFVLLHDRSDASAFFDAWIETIELTPETAAVR